MRLYQGDSGDDKEAEIHEELTYENGAGKAATYGPPSELMTEKRRSSDQQCNYLVNKGQPLEIVRMKKTGTVTDQGRPVKLLN